MASTPADSLITLPMNTWLDSGKYVIFNIAVPAQNDISSLRIKRRKQGRRFLTVGSPMVEIIDSMQLGRPLILKRLKKDLNPSDFQQVKSWEFEVVFYAPGFKRLTAQPLAQYLPPSPENPKGKQIHHSAVANGKQTATPKPTAEAAAVKSKQRTSVAKSQPSAKSVTKTVIQRAAKEKRQVPRRRKRKTPTGTIFTYGLLDGLAVEFSLASPFWVTQNLYTWYSYIDWRLALTAPYYAYWGDAAVGFTMEVASFDFTNTFPEGGAFKGHSVTLYANLFWLGAQASLGVGKYASAVGVTAALGGRFLEREHFYLSAGIRGVFVSQIADIGSGAWMDGRVSVGYKF